MNIESRGGVARDGGRASIWIRQLATGRDIKIVEPEQFISKGISFSPDSNYLYYRVLQPGQADWLHRIPVLGGDSQKVLKNAYSTVSFSPDGRRIAFVRNHSPVIGESNLVIANADGTNERIVTTHGGGELFAIPTRPVAPAWSPDGKVLACALLSGFNGTFSLLEVQAESGAERQIGTQRWPVVDALAWLPDGTGLMMTARDQSSPQTQIWHVAYPSGEARRVTNDLNEYVGMSLSADAGAMVVAQAARETDIWLVPTARPSDARAVTSGRGKPDGNWGLNWTPDGKLVYGSDASGNRDIWLLDPDKGTRRQLTKDARQNFYPQVTPDGQSALFFSDRGEAFGLWRTDIDGGNQRQLISGPLLRFDVTPDGRWIVYTSQSSRSIPSLWRARLDGGEPVELFKEHWVEIPAVSPDGKRIAFQYFGMGAGGVKIGHIPIEGGGITEIASVPFRLAPVLRWTPDGSAVAYVDNRGRAGQIWAQPVSGGPPRKLTDFKSDYLYWFDFSRDGKQLAVARGTTTSDVVLISNFR